MGARSRMKAERREARAVLDKAMTGITVTIDGADYRYDPRAVNHATREVMRKRYLKEKPDGA